MRGEGGTDRIRGSADRPDLMEEAGGLKVDVRSTVGLIGCPHFGEHGLGERPQSDTLSVEPRQVGDGLHPPTHRRDRISGVVKLADAVPEQIADVVARLPEHPLWIDGEPSRSVGAEDVAVVQVAVQHDRRRRRVAQLQEHALADFEQIGIDRSGTAVDACRAT